MGVSAARAAVCAGLAVSLTFPVPAHADDRTWTGGGGDNFWTTADNWLGGVAPIAGDALFFGGTTWLAPENDVTADSSFAGITFNSGAGAFVLSGNGITLGGNVTNNSTSVQTVQLDMILDSTRTVSGSGGMTLQGALSGGGGLTKTGSGILTLSGSTANTYDGLTTVSGGTLLLAKTSGNALGGDLTISGGQVTFSDSNPNNQIADDAVVTMSGASSVFNGTAFNAGYRAQNETIGSLIVTGGSFNTGTGGTGWTVTGAASFTGGAGNTRFLGHSTSTTRFGSLSLTDMTATAGNTPETFNSFTVYGNNAAKQSSIFVGSGGLTLDNSVINLRRGSATNAKGSRLVLDGDVLTTGTSASRIAEDAAGGTTGTVAVQLSSTAGTHTRTFNIGGGGADLTISVPVTNGAATSAGIIKTGDGTLTLSGVNTFSGDTQVNAGTLLLGNALALQRSTFDTQTGSVGTLSFGALTSATFGGLKGSNDLSLLNESSAPVTLTVGANNASTTFSGSLSGTGGALIKTGSGTLNLAGATANTYTGLTTLSGGTLQLAKTSGAIAVAGDIQVDGGKLQWSGTNQVANTASITLNSGTLETNSDTVANVTINNTSSPRTTWIHRLTITDTLRIAGGLPFLGSGTTTTASKVVMTSGGEIEMASNTGDTIMNIGSGGLSMSDAVWHLGISTLDSPFAARINLGGNFEGSGTNRITYYNTNGPRLLDLQGAARTFDIIDGTTTIDATIQNGGLTKTSAGTLTLSGANTFAGDTKVDAGTLLLDNSLALQGSTFDTQTGSVGTLSFGTLTEATFGGLKGANGLALLNGSPAPVTLTVGGNNASTTFSGSLSGTDGALIKTGSGTLTLSGASPNTYTGPTTVSGGTLTLGKSANVISVPGDLDISDGAKVTYSANNVNQQIASDATVTMSGASSALNCTGFNAGFRTINETIGSLDVSGGVFHTGTGTWTVTGAASFTGGAGNTIFLGNSGATAYFGSLSLTNMNAASSGDVANSFNVYGNNGSTQSSIFVGGGGLTLDNSIIYLRQGSGGALGSRLVLDGDVTTTGASASSIVTEGGTSGDVAVQLSSTGAAVTRTFDIGGGEADLTIAVPVTNGASSSAGITKTGAGTLTLSGSMANTYTGLTTVEAGRLALSKSTGVNAVAGNLDITGGKVTFGADEQIANTAAVTMSGATSIFNGTGFDAGFRNTNETIGSLFVTGGLFQTGIGAGWTVTGAVGFTGGDGDTIFVGNSTSTSHFGSLSLTNMNATAGTTANTPNSFTLYGSHASKQSSIFVGSGGLTLQGSVLNLRRGGDGAQGSRLVLDGDVTTTGTSASSIVTAGGTIGAVAVELSSTADPVTRTFNVGGGGANLTISVPVTNGASTSAGITKTGAGTLTFSGSMANTYTGLTTVSGGALQLNKTSGAVAVAGDILVNGGTLQWNATNQVADTASITLNSGILESNSDTVGNVTINSTNAGGQTHIHRLTITDTLTLAGGLPYLGSGTTTSANKVIMTPGGAIEMAANNADTIMNIGSGGLSMSDAVWHLGLLGAYPSPLPSSETARINLGGNFEGSGTNRITYYTTNGPRLLDLQGATRTFDITGGTTTIDATIQNGGLTKTGAGTLTLSAANTFTGPTSVEAGTLLVGGSIASDVTINGGWLKGDGTVGGVVVGPLGSISAGNSPGLLGVDGNYEQSGLMLAELAGTTKGETYDSIDVFGTATFNPGAVIDVDLLGFEPLLGDFFDILTAGQGITNTDLSVIEFDYSGAMSAYPLVASIVSLGGSAEALRLKAVPEPSAIILLSLGAAGLLAWPGRRRKRAARNNGERPWRNGTL
jgi:autotransporter-associated beta strand protein